MAIIYSYQENEELLNSDMLVGTATTLHNGKVRKITKNFTLGQLKTFINTGDLILSNGGTTGPATLVDNVLNIPVYQGQITLTTTGSSGAATLVGNTLNIPNYAASTPTLQSVTTAGNTTTLDVFANTFQTNTGYGLLDDGTVIGQTFQFPTNLSYLTYYGSTFNIWELPENSGTIALTSDIPVVTTPTLQQVTTAGNITTDAVTLGTTTIKQSTGTNVAIFRDNTNAIVGTVNEFGSLNFIGGSHTFGATGAAEIIAGTYRTQNYGDGFKDVANNVNFVASLNTGSTFGWSSKGTIEYAADYSANFGNRTLVDKAYVLSVIPSLTGYVPTSRTLTINGTTYDLSANRSWTIPTYTSPLTTKGDIYTYSTTDARLPVGLDTQVLIADSTTATGLKWGSNTAATPTGYYGAWQDNITQTAASSNIGYPMIFRTTDLSNGVTVVSNGTNLTRITFANTGIYNLQFSSQFQNSGNSQEDVTIWLRLNGVDVPGSSGFISVPARKAAGAGNEGHLITGWNYVLSVVGGQYYELVWSTSNSTNVTMQYYAAGSPPPSAASVIMTVTQQSGIMAGTGLTAINSLTGAVQTLATGTTGTDFGISSTGTTHTFNIPTASSTNRGLLSSTDWTTFNSKGNGTVTSVAALTLGTTGTDLSSTVATDTTTPVITLNVPTASATNRGALSSTDWSTFNGKQNALLDIAGVQDNGIYSTFMNGAICYFLAGVGAATFNNLRINSNLTLSGNTAYFSNNAVQFSTTATAGTLAFQRGVPFYHSGRSLMRFQPNIVSTDARYFVGISNLYQVSAPTNVEPTTLTQSIGVAKLSTSANLFIIHNDGTGVATSFDLGVNYPATSNLYIYDIKITSTFAGVYTGVTIRRTTISTGATISTDYTVPGNYPSVGINPALWITNNATASANSLYHFGAIGYNTTI